MGGDGKLVYRSSGYQPPDGFATMMTRVLDLKSVPTLEKSLKAHPNDLGLLAKLGGAAAMQNNEKAAVSYADRGKKAFASAKTAKDRGSYADLMNAVGDMFQLGEKFDKAIPYFQAAAASNAETGKLAYALYSEGYCYLSMNKPKEALAAANKAEALKGLSKSDSDIVQGLKRAANQQLGGGG